MIMRTGSAPRRALMIAALCVMSASVVASPSPADSAEAPATAGEDVVGIEVVSNRADLISAGDALVEVVLPAGTDASTLEVDVDGRDVTDAFAVRPGGRILGLVAGLEEGDNLVTARVGDGRGAQITITNHPRGGPVFSGPQVQPWICTTEDNGLGPAEDEQCNAPTIHEFFYKHAVTGQFESYDPDNPPADEFVATTTTDEGETVPYIVRRERGTLNRGIYDVAVLFDPGEPWEPWDPQSAWNHKLGFSFGGGCAPNHSQGSAQNALNDMMLSRGFAFGVSSVNVFGNGCNLHISAEALMMIKERITETLGEIRYTIGNGCSGGAEAQHSIAANYPGLLDGIRPECTYADGWTPALYDKGDCPLLMRYFNETSPHVWPAEAQRAAVTGGNPTTSICLEMGALGSGDQVWDPTTGCGFGEDWVYDPETNPEGVRCTLQDYNAAALGTRDDGFANGVIDHVGLQWGLHALYAGDISPEQFVDLNEKIGGFDIDFQWQPERTEADPEGVHNFYRSGQFSHGRNLAKVPSIDVRTDNTIDFHSNVHREVVRARLVDAWGNHDSQVHWFEPHPGPFALPTPIMSERTFVLVDEWLTAIEDDTASDPIEAKVVRNKPEAATEGCFLAGQRLGDQETCEPAYNSNELPRMVAGMPLTADVLKCQLKPVDRGDYRIHGVRFTDDQWDRLRQAFPDGVCDWSEPGVGQQPPRGAWLTLEDGPGGRPLGDPPTSVPFG